MIFSEVYGSYFKAVSEIIKSAIDGKLNDKKIIEAVQEIGFEESLLVVPEALKNQEWPLITETYDTPIKHKPDVPLTLVQKRWLKSLLNDPKIKLFDVDDTGLEDIEPLFDRETIVFFDQYDDGDPFEDETYISNFKTILKAFRENRKIRITFKSVRTGRKHRWECIPHRLEYSLKDDKFRFLTQGTKHIDTINIASIVRCELLDKYEEKDIRPLDFEKRELIFELMNERNALERVLLHFSHLRKETIKAEDNKYIIKLTYNVQDETEILIRVLSFGPMIKVLEPTGFVRQIRRRLEMQKSYNVPNRTDS